MKNPASSILTTFGPTLFAIAIGAASVQSAAAGVGASISPAASAQPAPGHPEPLDANAKVPPLTYRSALDTYQKQSSDEQAPADTRWRAANDEVAKADGHGSHGAPAAAPAPVTPSPAAAAAAKAATADHSKHH